MPGEPVTATFLKKKKEQKKAVQHLHTLFCTKLF